MRFRRPGITVSRPFTPDDFTRVVTSAARVREVVAACARAAP
jgi:hypothetical protein